LVVDPGEDATADRIFVIGHYRSEGATFIVIATSSL
jgi:hypothetical protein